MSCNDSYLTIMTFMSYYDNLLAYGRIVIDTIISLLWIIVTYEWPWNNLGGTLCTVCNTVRYAMQCLILSKAICIQSTDPGNLVDILNYCPVYTESSYPYL